MGIFPPGRAPDFVRRLPPPPPALLRPFLTRFAAGVLRRHPEIAGRLGAYAERRFLIDPVDMPVAFLLVPDPEAPLLSPCVRGAEPPWDAAVRGALAKLLRLVNGEEDSDALFFSRDIAIEGDTEAALALRNALDDAGVNLAEEIEAMLGPLGPPLAAARKRLTPLLEHLARAVAEERKRHREAP